ncbi:MAG: hypothetical protein JWM34_400 [Ilumatobacteraceae bacterium]|nr:hypothetical protein [Ilumatobacteraceae bacterium]
MADEDAPPNGQQQGHLHGYLPFSSDGHVARWVPVDETPGDEASSAHETPVDGESATNEEVLSLVWENEAWTASGMVGREQIHYILRISPTWHVRQFLLFRDMDDPDLWLGTDGHGRWGEMNGAHRPELDGCVDLDLPCTPFTNTLPIRRLPLRVGDTADITVAYVDVETLDVRPDHQRYTRVDTHRWRFEQLETGWHQEFEVDEHGLVRDYPTLFRRVA